MKEEFSEGLGGYTADLLKGNDFEIHGFDISPNNEKIVFFVGRLVNEKGVQVLIDAAPKVLKHYNEAKFVIVGKGPQLDYLKNKAISLNISSKVEFTGYLSDDKLNKLYKCADIAVFPSLYEPFGIVALEGIVADVPIVISDTGGLGEIVEHGVDGMKCYAGNSNSLADSILEILFNQEKADSMRKMAIRKVESVYNWDTICKQTLGVYEDVINESERSNWKSSNFKEKLQNL